MLFSTSACACMCSAGVVVLVSMQVLRRGDEKSAF